MNITSATRNHRIMAMLANLIPGCKSLGLRNPKVATSKSSVYLNSDDAASASSFGVW